ncbi:hypothetical protein [Streptomyces flavidovirens]|uniref:hypothetical protein n=1 Tax=Streptomyces flavidovirens TaxID=67298 RepID=UPI003F55A2BE
MDITIHPVFLPDDAPDASLACHRGTLGLEVRKGAHRLAGTRRLQGPKRRERPGTCAERHPGRHRRSGGRRTVASTAPTK